MIANIFGVDGGIVVVVAIIVLVGGSQLPKIARNVGLAGREFRKAQEEAEAEEREKTAKANQPTPAAPQPLTPVAPTSEESVTLSRSELDALLKAREEQARRESAGPPAT
jgi:sec-independent protein translocase protein TatA